MAKEVGHLNEMIREKSEFVDDMRRELERVVVGQKYMVERLLIGLLTGGHRFGCRS